MYTNSKIDFKKDRVLGDPREMSRKMSPQEGKPTCQTDMRKPS
jgi:hypothetical protein